MEHKIYRICLLSVVILAIVGGIFYYLNYVQKGTEIKEGTLVQMEKAAQSVAEVSAVGARFVERA